MKIVVLDAATLGEDLDLSPLSRFGEVTVYKNTSRDEIASRLQGADVALVNKVKLNSDTLVGVDSLKLICVFATGYDNIELPYCKEKGIAVCNVVGYSTQSVAQLTVAMALELFNHMPEYTSYVKSGAYTESGVANRLTPVYHEIAGKTWGIVGLGNIGKQVARVAEALGCRVLAFKRTPEEGYNCVDLDTLLRESDIVSVHLPLSEKTFNIISQNKIALMKENAIFINVARGAVVDEFALTAAVKMGMIGGIGIDVYSAEPMSATSPYNEIKHLPNVCLTPHMAWGSAEARVRCLEDICKSIEAFQNGEQRSRVC